MARLVALATRVATGLRSTTSPGIPVDHSIPMRGYEYVFTFKPSSYLFLLDLPLGNERASRLPPKPACHIYIHTHTESPSDALGSLELIYWELLG